MKIMCAKTCYQLGIAAFCLALSTAAFAGKGAEVKLNGANNANVDRQAIQDAIDSAPGEDLVVKLKGTFQLDGLDIIVDRSNIVIKGDKQGALLKGKLGPDGLPIEDFDNFPNRGFLIESASPVSNIEIKDLSLTGLRTPVFAKGEMNTITGVTVKNNHVENSFFGVALTGSTSDIFIANNTVLGASSNAITVFSTGAGSPSNITIVDNHLADAIFDAVYLFQVSGVVIANNYLSTADEDDFPAPLAAEGMNSDILVEGNVIEGGFTGILLLDDASNFSITHNCIRDGGTQGFPGFNGGGVQLGFFGIPSSGYAIEDNSYEGNVADPGQVSRDVWLTSSASNNTVLEHAGTIVLDEGSSNSVGTLLSDPVDYCAN